MFEILYPIHAVGTINDGAVYSTDTTSTHSKIANSWAVIVGLALIFKRDIAYLYVVFSNLHTPECRQHKGLVEEKFFLGYLNVLKICLLCTFTCLVKWFSTLYSTCATF